MRDFDESNDKLPIQGYINDPYDDVVADTGMKTWTLPASADRFYNIDNVCELTSLSESTVYRMIDRREFPAGYLIRGARRRAWRQSDIESWIKRSFKPATP